MSPVETEPSPDGAEEPQGLGRRAVRGAAVTIVGQMAKIGLQILSVVILSRLLRPADYGLLAMVMAVIGVADIFRDFGLSSAAIQAPTLSREQQTNLFWVNTGLGAVLSLVALAAAPLVAALFRQPAVEVITIGLAANFLLNGMATQYRADLNRRMLFRRLALADVVSPALGLAVAIVVALSGGGFWALVVQQLVQVGSMLIVVVICAGWLPGWYHRKVSIKHFMKFGTQLAMSQILGYIGNNTDTVALGLTVSPAQLGLYNRAYQLIMTPLGQIRGPLSTVAIPVLSRTQHDEETFQSYVARGQMAMGYTIVVGLAAAAAAAGPLVEVFLGSQWTDATDVLRLLAIGAALQTLSFVGYWVYVTKGLVRHLLTYTVFSTVFRVVCVVVGSFFGVIGVAAAMAVVPLCLWPVSFWWLSRRASVPVKRLWLGGIRVIVFSTLVGGATALAVMLAGGLPAWLGVLFALLAAGAAFAALGFLVPPFRKDLKSVIALARNLRR